MTQTLSDSTLSPIPFSPFSSYSVASGATSDDAPDLGAFTTVFRALNTFHPRPLNSDVDDAQSATPTTSAFTFSQSDYDSEAVRAPTVWLHRRISSYLSPTTPDSSRGRSLPPSDSDSTASDIDRTALDSSEVDDDLVDQPSLGYLDGALEFIAAEREKWAAQRDSGLRGNGSTATSDSAWRHVVQPRRKRQRKRNRSVQDTRRLEQAGEEGVATIGSAADGIEEASGNYEDEDADDSSSSFDAPSPSQYYKSTPATPRRVAFKQSRERISAVKTNPRLHHSKSTPNLNQPASIPLDARVIQLRTLVHKLRHIFPLEAGALSSILSTDRPDGTTFVDTRGPAPQRHDKLIHVFIDHSNILIGFITYLRRHWQHLARKHKQAHLSHAALALILERGRPVTRRVLVASSPLYQPMDTAVQLGYEVRIYARVPDTGDGADRQQLLTHNHNNSISQSNGEPSSSHRKSRKGTPTYTRGHSRKASASGGGTSTESEPGSGSSGAGSNGARVRYREQGVDELLQLKLHQAIADVDEVPPDATIVLATGDGNVGQFNEEGFLGCVRTALKRGWRVELYAWEGGLSKAWMREFGESSYSQRFQIHILDRFATDLLEIS